jgi:hypothetical protein
MKKRTFAKSFQSAARLSALLLLSSLCGCSDSGDRWNLEFRANTRAAVRFDVVAVNLNDLQEWKSVSVDDYWKPGNSLRANAPRLTFEVVDGKISLLEVTNIPGSASQGITAKGDSILTVPRSSAAWKEWLDVRKAVGLVVIGDFPGSGGAGEVRKQIVPLFSGAWEASKNTLVFQIQDSRIQTFTPFSTKAAKYLTKYAF